MNVIQPAATTDATPAPHNPDPIRCINGDWGFWDETWSDWSGGFATEADARAAFRTYCENL